MNWEVIVIDDGSTDNTAAIVENFDVTLIRQTYNRGYGAALKTGIRSASADKVVFIDADGQHSPEYLETFCDHLDEHDLVIGQRPPMANKMTRLPGKWLIGKVASFLSGTEIPDLNSGLRGFKRDIIHGFLNVCPNGFSFSTTSTMLFLTGGFRIKWVPIEIRMRQGGKSQVNQLKDGLATILLILRCIVLFNPLRVFFPISFFLLLIGSTFSIYGLIAYRSFPGTGIVVIVSGVMVFFSGLIADLVSTMARRESSVSAGEYSRKGKTFKPGRDHPVSAGVIPGMFTFEQGEKNRTH